MQMAKICKKFAKFIELIKIFTSRSDVKMIANMHSKDARRQMYANAYELKGFFNLHPTIK